MSLFVDFNDSLPCGVCQCVVAGRPRCLAALTPAKPGDHRAGSVHPAAGPCGSELRTLIRMGVKIIDIIESQVGTGIVVGIKIRVEDNLRPYFLSAPRRMDVAGFRNES